jgi:hypothetical protein
MGHAAVRKHLSLWACFTVIQPADSAGRKLKQCTILSATARHWLVSAIMFLGIYRTKRYKHGFSKGLLSLYKRHRIAESELNEHLGLHNKPKAEVHPEH